MGRERDETLREDLLERAVAYALEHGFSGLSLRPLAEGIGSSARMLIHHFGSKEVLLALMVERIEAQYLALTDALLGQEGHPLRMLERLWHSFDDPALEPAMRSIFELWGGALLHPAQLERLRVSLVDAWVSRLSSAYARAGLEDARAQALAALTVGTVHGLLLQRLTTDERARIQTAFEHFVRGLERELNTP